MLQSNVRLSNLELEEATCRTCCAIAIGVYKVVMIERRAYKFKADRTMRQSKGLVLERLRLDIEDLNFSQVKALQDSYVVAISKHLCGPATDLSLRCCLSNGELGNTSATGSSNEDTQPQFKPVVDGLGIATCCHHLCQWKSYINKRFFKNLGFSKDDFHVTTWLTSWALSGTHEHELPGCDTSEAKEFLPSRYAYHLLKTCSVFLFVFYVLKVF